MAGTNNEVWRSVDGAVCEKIKPNTHSDDPFDPAAGWEARHPAAYVVRQDKMWIGGGDSHQGHHLPDAGSSTDGLNWDCHARSTPWRRRQYHYVAVFDNRLWILEGAGSTGNANDAWYSEDGANWTEVPSTPWNERHAASVFVCRDPLWMVAGNHMERDVWKLEKKYERED